MLRASLPSFTLTGVHSSTAGKWLKRGLMAAAVLGGIGLMSYFVVDRALTAKAAVGRLSGSQQVALDQCAEAAFMFHDVRWAAACMMIAEQSEAKHGACLKDPAKPADLGTDYCDRKFPLQDGSVDCDLPNSRAASLNALLRDAEQKCRAEARLAP